MAASVGFGLRVLQPHINRFLATHPDLKIDFKLNDNTIDLVEQGIDVAIRIGNLSDSSLVARRVGSSHGVVVASRTYIDALPTALSLPLTPDDLLLHPCVVYTELRTRNVWSFAGADGSVVKVPVSGPLQTNNSEVVRAAVLSGMGIAAPPTWMFTDELASGDVQILLPDWEIKSLPIHLLFAPHRQGAAKVRAFSEHMALALAG